MQLRLDFLRELLVALDRIDQRCVLRLRELAQRPLRGQRLRNVDVVEVAVADAEQRASNCIF